MPLDFSVSTRELYLTVASDPDINSSEGDVFNSRVDTVTVLDLLASPPSDFLTLQFSGSYVRGHSVDSLTLTFTTFFRGPWASTVDSEFSLTMEFVTTTLSYNRVPVVYFATTLSIFVL